MKLSLPEDQKKSILTFRWLQILTVMILISTSHTKISLWSPGYSLALFFFLSNLILFLLPRDSYGRVWLPLAIFLLDVAIISIAIYLTGGVILDLYLAYLLTIFMSAWVQELKGSLFTAGIAGGIYTWIGFKMGFLLHEPDFLIRIPFLFLTAFFSGFLAQRVRIQKKEFVRMEEIQRTLEGNLRQATQSEEQAYEKLLSFYEYSEKILQSIEEGVMVVDPSGMVTVFNRGAERITGYKPHEICGKPLSEWKGLIALNHYLQRAKEYQGNAKDGVMEIITATQKVISIEVSLSFLKDPHGNETGIIVLFCGRRSKEDEEEGGEPLSSTSRLREGGMKKILVVDDDAHSRLLFQELFSESGYEVITASNGHEALSRILNEKPDLVILDIWMPEIHGLEVLAWSQKYRGSLPFVICTAASDLSKDPGVKSPNVKGFLTKPVDVVDLKTKIRQILQ